MYVVNEDEDGVSFPTEETFQKSTFPPFTFYNLCLITSCNSRNPPSTPRNQKVKENGGSSGFSRYPWVCSAMDLSLAVCDSGQGIQPLPSLSFLMYKMRAIFLFTLERCFSRITNEVTHKKQSTTAYGAQKGKYIDDYFFTIVGDLRFSQLAKDPHVSLIRLETSKQTNYAFAFSLPLL